MTEREKKRPINVLQVIGEMVMGGAESRVMEVFRHLDPKRVHYDFLVFNPREQYFDAEITAREAGSTGCSRATGSTMRQLAGGRWRNSSVPIRRSISYRGI